MRRRGSAGRRAAGCARTVRALYRLARCAALAGLLVCIGGRDARALFPSFSFTMPGGGSSLCVTSVTNFAEEPFTDGQVKAIRRGVTTKQEILAWFGPPLAIARPGTVIKVPRPAFSQRGAGSDDVPSDELFRLFGPVPGPDADMVVYYYHDIIEKHDVGGPRGCIPVSFDLLSGRSSVSAKKLWVLIDQRAGRVADHRLELPEGAGGAAGEESHVPWKQ